MARPLVIFAAALLAASTLAGSASAEMAAARCAVPSDLIADAPVLPGLAQRFRDRQPVVIVAIGGASTSGVAAGDPAKAYPQQLQLALQRRHPDVPITVLNKGVPRQTARDMIARFNADVLAAKPNLVIWETGTVDAVRAVEIDDFAEALEQGITALRAHGAAIMLVDMQYNPSLASVIDFGPYLDALHRAADLDGVYLFRRYDIMRYWSDNGRFELVEVPRAKQSGLAAEIYRCLGDAMADAIDRAAR